MVDARPTPSQVLHQQTAGRTLRQQRAAEAAQRQQAMEDSVLEAAARLDRADDRLEARQLREAALSISDHRAAEDARTRRAVNEMEA